MFLVKLTTNFGLKKPEGSDIVNIDDFNYNADILDSKIKEVSSSIESLELIASNVKMANGSTVEDSITNLQAELNGNVSTLENNINAIREVL